MAKRDLTNLERVVGIGPLDNHPARLQERIEELEKRVAELEANQMPRAVADTSKWNVTDHGDSPWRKMFNESGEYIG